MTGLTVGVGRGKERPMLTLANRARNLCLTGIYLAALATGGCSNAGQGLITGGTLGALGGMAIGSTYGGMGEGAVIGAVLGGLTGAVIGDQNARWDYRAAGYYGGYYGGGGYYAPAYYGCPPGYSVRYSGYGHWCR